MSENIDVVKREMIELETAYIAYVKEHGFHYQEFADPPAGSFMEKYKTRMHELTVASGVKPLEYFPT